MSATVPTQFRKAAGCSFCNLLDEFLGSSSRLGRKSLGIKFGFVVGNVGDNGYHFSVLEILRTIELDEQLIA